MITNINFTDPQGETHTGAVFCLKMASVHNTSGESVTRSGDYSTPVTTTDTPQSFVNYQPVYWTTQANKDAGNAPYPLYNGEADSNTFSFVLDASYDNMTLEAQAEKHLQDVVLAPMLNA